MSDGQINVIFMVLNATFRFVLGHWSIILHNHMHSIVPYSWYQEQFFYRPFDMHRSLPFGCSPNNLFNIILKHYFKQCRYMLTVPLCLCFMQTITHTTHTTAEITNTDAPHTDPKTAYEEHICINVQNSARTYQ